MSKTAMYERFTDRARKIMQLAVEEARSVGHTYLGTEDILIGLAVEKKLAEKEDEIGGIAGNVLEGMGADVDTLRDEVKTIIPTGPEISEDDEQYTFPLTPRAKKLIKYAMEEAQELNLNYVGTEHLLLGLVRVNEGVAREALRNLSLNLEDIRRDVLIVLGHGL